MMPLDTEIDLGPGHVALEWTQLPLQKGAQQPRPSFQPMPILAKLSPISAAAELLFHSKRVAS